MFFVNSEGQRTTPHRFRHSNSVMIRDAGLPPSSTLHRTFSDFSIHWDQTTHEYFTPRVAISPLFKHHLDFYDIHVYLRFPIRCWVPKCTTFILQDEFLFTLELWWQHRYQRTSYSIWRWRRKIRNNSKNDAYHIYLDMPFINQVLHR